MKFYTVLIALITLTTSYAQNTIQSIDKQVEKYNAHLTEAIEAEMEDYISKIEIKSHLIKRAIGSVDHLITIYFDRHDVMSENENGMFEVHKSIIRKVNLTIEHPSSRIIYSFYFDEKGSLIFYEEEASISECYVHTLYFEKDQCLQTKQVLIADEFCDNNYIKAYKRTELNAADKDEVAIVLSKANHYKSVLAIQYELMME